jgi:hypothetical protein
VSTREERRESSRILADVKVHRLAVLVVGARLSLATPLLIARDRAEVGDFHDDGLEWTTVRGREDVGSAGELEATATSIAGSCTWSGAEGELVDRGGEAGRSFAASWGRRTGLAKVENRKAKRSLGRNTDQESRSLHNA